MSKEQYKPEWAQNLEDWGKKQENRWNKNKKPKHLRKGELVWGIFGLVLSLFIVTYAPIWFPHFFTDAYPAVLYVFYTVIALQIIGTFLLILISYKPIFYVVQAAVNALAVVSFITLITLFPFNVPEPLVWLVKFGLLVGLVVTAVTVVAQLIIGFTSLFFD